MCRESARVRHRPGSRRAARRASPALPSAPMRRVRVAPHRARGRADISDGDDQLADRRPGAELGNRLAAVFEAEALRDARLDLALFPQLEQPSDISADARRLASDENAHEASSEE